MKKIIMCILVVVTLIATYFLFGRTEKNYHTNLFYMDTYIEVSIYSNDKVKAETALKEVEKIYQDYHQLTDRYKAYEGVVNLYTIAHNTLPDQTLKLDERLSTLLQFALKWEEKSGSKLNIAFGPVIDVWKKYRELETGIPTRLELEEAKKGAAVSFTFVGENEIANNHVNLDLGAVAKGYTTEIAAQYLKDHGINQFLINAGGNVCVGEKKEGLYQIGVEDPTDPTKLYQIIKGNNLSVVTSGSYQRYYEYEGKRYHHIIDPETLYPSQYMESVTVVTKDSGLADCLSTLLFLMPVEEGKAFLKQVDAEAIWYLMDGTIVKSDGFSQYE